jgi:uncharacterized protein (DUF4415 family)
MPRKKSSGARKLDPELAKLVSEYSERLGISKQHAHDLLSDLRAVLREDRKKESKRAKGVVVRGTSWGKSDDAPELTTEYFKRADVYRGDKLIRRGRPPSEHPKEAIKLRIDPDVLEHFRATGPGWQTRINDALRRAAKLKISKVS